MLGAAVMSAMLVAFGATSALAQAGNDIDCSLTSTGNTPINDLGTGTYEGAEGGLYPGGSNEITDDHLALGMVRASEILPRNEAGEPDPDGKIVFASIGVSNTRREFTAFLSVAGADPDMADSIVLVNGAQNGEPVSAWLDPNAGVWQLYDRALTNAGVTAAQVQAAWVKIPEGFNTEPPAFPTNALEYRNELTSALRTIQDKMPNLQVAYMSSRIYGGYNAVSSPNPEPNAYEEGFGVKWVIEAQMAGNPVLNANPDTGEVEAPWVAWGPYLWADGTTPRADGTTWQCGDINSDGIHPNGAGSDKVAGMLLDFLHEEPTAEWFFGEPVVVTEEPTGESVTTSTIAGDTGLTEAALPTTSPDSRGGGGRQETGSEGATDSTRRDRGDRGDRGDRTSTTDAPTTTTETTGSTLATVIVGERQAVPPIVWALVGVGVLMLGFLAVRAMRRGESEPPDDDLAQ
ncbi:hypothetical protein BH24ACT7_BH24ACT7_01980 [soil metagenome]